MPIFPEGKLEKINIERDEKQLSEIWHCEYYPAIVGKYLSVV
jgi:hypothetical protein